MLLQFSKQYKSIEGLPDVELPDFTVVTGVNGAGKSHLLEGIEKGALIIQSCPRQEGVQRFTTKTLLAQFENQASSVVQHHQRKTRKDVVKAIKGKISEGLHNLKTYFSKKQSNLPECFSIPSWLASVNQVEFEKHYVPPDEEIKDPFEGNRRKNAWSQFENFRCRLSGLGLEFRQHRDIEELIAKHAAITGRPVLAFTEADIENAIPLTWNPVEGMSLKFSSWFEAYSTTWERNRMLRYYSETHGEHHSWFKDEEFYARFGPKPWDLANEVLEQCGASYRFSAPKFAMDGNQGVWVHNVQVDGATSSYEISELSTGERVVLGVISLLYRATPSRAITPLPKLLLLDEIDASLHPAYTKALISVLVKTLVEKCGVKVILVTHSPSTVALAACRT